MQKTETYQFNLIEGSDAFSQEPINENIKAIEAILAKMPRFQAGTYTGTGGSGEDSPNSLTFNFEPKLVMISGDTYYSIFLANNQHGITLSHSLGTDHIRQKLSWDGNTVTWYADGHYQNHTIYGITAFDQLNSGGTVYNYLAIG